MPKGNLLEQLPAEWVSRYCQVALSKWDESLQHLRHNPDHTDRHYRILYKRACNLMQGALGFGFRVYGYAGGFDEECTEIYGRVHKCYQESQEGEPQEPGAEAEEIQEGN